MKKLFFLALSILFVSPVMAKTTPWNTSGHPTKVSVSQTFVLNSDVESVTGDISISESQFRVSHDHYFGEIPLTLKLGYKHIEIDEDLALELPSHLEKWDIGAGIMFPAPFVDRDDVFMGFDASLSVATDDGDFEESAARFPMRSYVVYKPSDVWMFVAGANVTFDTDREVFPFFGFKYKPNDKLTVNFAKVNPTISYKVSEKLKVFAEGNFTNDEYEVTQNNTAGKVLEFQQIAAGAGVKYKLTDSSKVKFSVGGVFDRKIEYEEGGGKAAIDNGVYLSLKFMSRF